MVEEINKIHVYGNGFNFKETTLLLAGPGSIGFLGSLVIDLIVHNYNLERVAILDSAFIEQIVGTRVYSQDKDSLLYTAFEAYQGEKLPGVTVLQIRAHPITGHALALSKSLADWIQNSEFEKVIIVTGVDKSRRTDAQLQGSPIRFCVNSEESSLPALLSPRLKAMEEIKNPHNLYPATLPPGGGITQFLLNDLATSKIPAAAITYFTESGDNTIPAFQLADKLTPILSPSIVESNKPWKAPISWQRLYGEETELRELF